MMELFFEWAAKNQWTLSLAGEPAPLPDAIIRRYAAIPADYLDFAGRLEKCMSRDETLWFITPAGFAESDPDKWRYNEFEILSLEAAEDDEDWQEEITAFWNCHLPVVMRTGDSSYSYYALRLSDGAVVTGEEPEFEETEKVADSFAEFLGKIVAGQLSL